MKRGDKKGFTIIEVSLVLAIAGLIFLMIFIALPALRRTQRDAARRDDMMKFIKEVKSFQTNNRGALPSGASDAVVSYTWGDDSITNANATSWGGFLREYMGEKFEDPSGGKYNLVVIKCSGSAVGDECENDTYLKDLGSSAFTTEHKVIVVTQAECSGERAIRVANPRKIAVLYRLEGAGAYCGNT